MKFLIDTNPHKVEMWVKELPDFVAGQLIVPAARRKNWGGRFGMDNSAFVRFDEEKFARMLKANEPYAESCLFVTCPDIVGNAKRTLEIWRYRSQFIPPVYKRALVSQDGFEDLDIPWDEIDVLFVGGGDPWKDSAASKDIVKTAKILKKHVHVGRVNQVRRYRLFAEIGADTCDGSSIAIHDYKLRKIASEFSSMELQGGLFGESASNVT